MTLFTGEFCRKGCSMNNPDWKHIECFLFRGIILKSVFLTDHLRSEEHTSELQSPTTCSKSLLKSLLATKWRLWLLYSIKTEASPEARTFKPQIYGHIFTKQLNKSRVTCALHMLFTKHCITNKTDLRKHIDWSMFSSKTGNNQTNEAWECFCMQATSWRCAQKWVTCNFYLQRICFKHFHFHRCNIANGWNSFNKEKMNI